MANKLPMAMIHEPCGTVISDPTGTYGDHSYDSPQPPMQSDKEFYENYMTGTYFLSSGYDGFMKVFSLQKIVLCLIMTSRTQLQPLLSL